MATSPYRTLRFRIVFLILGLGLVLLQAMVLQRFGIPWKMAAWDSVVSNVFLLGMAVVVTVILQFYIPQQNRYGYIIFLCAMLALIWIVCSRIILFLIADQDPEYTRFFIQSVPIRLVTGFLIISCMALISVLLYTLQDQRETESRKTEAERLSREAELYNLRQQLQPHFLFNSLNSINALIVSQPQQARTMIQQLSDFLRGTLKKEADQWISVTEELQHLELYLGIEKVRFGHRLSASVENHATSPDVRLPAMLLQPLVENAIKFGLYDTTGAILIRIHVAEEGKNVVVQITNPFDPETTSPKTGTGFGLNSVQRRLYLLFNRTDLLQTETQGNQFITTVKIPQTA